MKPTFRLVPLLFALVSATGIPGQGCAAETNSFNTPTGSINTRNALEMYFWEDMLLLLVAPDALVKIDVRSSRERFPL
jgi:hypothetical protein